MSNVSPPKATRLVSDCTAAQGRAGSARPVQQSPSVSATKTGTRRRRNTTRALATVRRPTSSKPAPDHPGGRGGDERRAQQTEQQEQGAGSRLAEAALKHRHQKRDAPAHLVDYRIQRLCVRAGFDGQPLGEAGGRCRSSGGRAGRRLDGRLPVPGDACRWTSARPAGPSQSSSGLLVSGGKEMLGSARTY